MPVEIRELVIKGLVSNSKSIEKKFNDFNSPLLNSTFSDRLKKEIIKECVETVLEKLDRQKLR